MKICQFKVKSVSVLFALVVASVLALGSAHPAFASSTGNPDKHKHGTNETRPSTIRPLTGDPNDPIDSGCTTNTTISTIGASSFNYTHNGVTHNFSVQVRHSPKCNKDWARLWENNGSGDCIYERGGPVFLYIHDDISNADQSVTSSQICDDAWTDMIPHAMEQGGAAINDGSGNLASVNLLNI